MIFFFFWERVWRESSTVTSSTALQEDPGLVPSTLWWFTASVSDVSFWSGRKQGMHIVHTHRHTQAKYLRHKVQHLKLKNHIWRNSSWVKVGLEVVCLFCLFCFSEKAFNYKLIVFGIYGTIQNNPFFFLSNLWHFESLKEFAHIVTWVGDRIDRIIDIAAGQPCHNCGSIADPGFPSFEHGVCLFISTVQSPGSLPTLSLFPNQKPFVTFASSVFRCWLSFCDAEHWTLW